MDTKIENRILKKNMLFVALLLFVMLICAGFTSPLYPNYNGLDSSMFLVTAKGILSGKIPYIDLFDHKGPVFFWMEAIGYAIGQRTGVWILQCIFAFFDLLFIRRICKRIASNEIIGEIAGAVTFLYTFQHGNLTEEFGLPFVLLGMYYMISFLASTEEKHPPKYALLYGILFGLIAFSRINNAIVLCSLILCIGIVLITNKQWKNLFENFIAGTVGIAIIAVPMCIYFYVHEGLYDMLYATFLHNLIYAKEKTHVTILSAQFITQMIRFLPGIFSVIVFIKNVKTNRRLFASLLFSSIMVYGMLVYTNVYLHYFMLGLPVFAVAASCTFYKGDRIQVLHPITTMKQLIKGEYKTLKITCLAVIALYALLSAYSACAPIYKTFLTDIAADKQEQVSQSLSIIPQNERESVIGYGVLPDCYIYGDIVPCYKYYTLHEWMTSNRRDVYGDFLNYLSENHPLWVMTASDINNTDVLDILNSDYTLMVSDDYCRYYKYAF